MPKFTVVINSQKWIGYLPNLKSEYRRPNGLRGWSNVTPIFTPRCRPNDLLICKSLRRFIDISTI